MAIEVGNRPGTAKLLPFLLLENAQRTRNSFLEQNGFYRVQNVQHDLEQKCKSLILLIKLLRFSALALPSGIEPLSPP
jgi:hypothetical protein